LGEGPIRSFAMVMSIGIPLALFSTLIFMQWLLAWWLRHFSPTKIAGLAGNIIPANSSIAFMHWRKGIAGLTFALVTLTIGLYAVAGINYGIDFSGGSLAVLEARWEDIIPTLATKADLGDLRTELHKMDASLTRWMLTTAVALFVGIAGMLFAQQRSLDNAISRLERLYVATQTATTTPPPPPATLPQD